MRVLQADGSTASSLMLVIDGEDTAAGVGGPSLEAMQPASPAPGHDALAAGDRRCAAVGVG